MFLNTLRLKTRKFAKLKIVILHIQKRSNTYLFTDEQPSRCYYKKSSSGNRWRNEHFRESKIYYFMFSTLRFLIIVRTKILQFLRFSQKNN